MWIAQGRLACNPVIANAASRVGKPALRGCKVLDFDDMIVAFDATSYSETRCWVPGETKTKASDIRRTDSSKNNASMVMMKKTETVAFLRVVAVAVGLEIIAIFFSKLFLFSSIRLMLIFGSTKFKSRCFLDVF